MSFLLVCKIAIVYLVVLIDVKIYTRVSKKLKIVVIPRRNDERTDRRALNEVNLLLINSKRFLLRQLADRNDVFKPF